MRGIERVGERSRELCRAGCAFPATINIAEQGNDFIRVLAFDKDGDCLQVARTTSEESDIMDDAIVKIEVNLLGTDIFCFVGVVHFLSFPDSIENMFL